MIARASQAVADIATRVAGELGVSLYYMEVSGPTLRILIDAPAGATHATCVAFSRSMSAELDFRDLLPGDYRLEVSSPGIERRLYRPTDYQNAVGRHVRVRTRDGACDGVISAADDAGVTLAVEENGVSNAVRIEHAAILSGRVRVSDEELFAEAARRREARQAGGDSQ